MHYEFNKADFFKVILILYYKLFYEIFSYRTRGDANGIGQNIRL